METECVYEWEMVSVFVLVCVCTCDRDGEKWECVFVCERERKRKKERKYVYVFVCSLIERDGDKLFRVWVRVCEFVCVESVREREWEWDGVW